MEIRGTDGKSHTPLGSIFLMRGRGADSGIEGNIRGALLRRSRGNISAALSVRARKCSATALLACHAVDGILQSPGDERGADLHLVAAFPPAGAEGVDDSLFGRLGLAEILAILLGFLGYALALTFFWSGSCSSRGSGSDWGDPPV